MGVFGDIMGAIFGKRAEANPASGPASEQAVIDVEKILVDRAEKEHAEARLAASIVDLMKLLDLDSSQTARKQLAHRTDIRRRHEHSAEHECLAAQARHAQAGR